ncbi:glutathione S-transferase N-terminal domain-containing protein [Pararhizobium haloflavum]|uniref:glutathione S-transferase N-terminal domain-containing protein n=1 Tax=Pararhizobium haloflavum TaxID=2037914 RepID=UPI0012FFE017|nr:glutathione S-transferase N-terminal domain-containing protein [Pararhizobium haloflavum]
MKLYCSANSPYARKVRVVAVELEVFDKIEFVETNPRDAETGFWDLNPVGKIPALALGDGQVIYDSPVICEYLDDQYGEGTLGGSGSSIWRIKTLVALADGMMDAAMAARLEGMRPENEQSPAWIEKQLATVDRGFDALQDCVDELDGEVDQASIAAACAIFWIGFRHPQRDWLAGREDLANWHRRFSERPSMKRTAPDAGL